MGAAETGLRVFLKAAGGGFDSLQTFPLPYATFLNPHGLAIGDVNNDGAADVVLANYNYGLVVLLNRCLTSPPVIEAQVGRDLFYQLTASNGATSFQADESAFNALGLTFSGATGQISGTPLTAGTFQFAVQAVGSKTGTGTIQINVSPRIDFNEARGSYFAVFGDMNQSGNQRTGFLQLAVRPGGTFTGKLRFAGYVVPLRGRFDADGSATLTLRVRNEDPVQLQLQVSRDGDGYSVAATLQFPDGTPGNFILQRRTAFSMDSPAPMAGNYTLLLSPTGSNLLSRSAGFGAMTVDQSGRARCIVILSDGRPLATGSSVVESDSLPLFFSSYHRTGAVGGSLEFADLPATDCTADFFWTKPPTASPLLPEAVQTTLKLEGSRFVRAPFLDGFSHAMVEFVGGSLAVPLTHDLAIDSNSRISVLNATSDRLRLKLFGGGVGVLGSFRSEETAFFTGVWLQKPNFIGGISFSKSGPGAFRIIPTDENDADASAASETSFGSKF
ncbi:MAG: putative Ig domain-containing protein [Verrucomicrobiota bacterium]|nr:putative Ig domain-containing protein [Verrucomicrobiota bacterium]